MQRENWKAIEGNHAVSLVGADRALLDKVQTRLALGDGEFLHFLVMIDKAAAGSDRLAVVRLATTLSAEHKERVKQRVTRFHRLLAQ
jgi:hypothetical protein